MPVIPWSWWISIEPIALHKARMMPGVDEVACPPPPSPLHG
jgi:hypothetical protein